MTVTPGGIGELGQAALKITQSEMGQPTSASLTQFETAMSTALSGQGAPAFEPVRVAQTGPLTEVPQTSPVVAATAFDPVRATQAGQPVTGASTADDRAAAGLGVIGAVEGTPGQTILSGLERLRGVFDGKIGGIGARMDNTEMSVQAMVSLQAEVVEYSVLVDVSSKLAGKSTQAMDSLMKGQ